MNRLTAALLAATLPLATLAACDRKAPETTATPSPSAIVVVSGARLVLPAVPGNPAALYLTVANPGDAPIRLTRISVAGAASTELHETRGGAMTPVEGLDIAPGAAVSLEPGARHAMVMGLNPAPAVGSDVAVTLDLANGATASAKARVEPAGGATSMDAMHGMDGHDMGGMH